MALNVAVQMDPIERINIRGDSTFALLLGSASARLSAVLLHARPAIAARRQSIGERAPARGARHRRRPFHARRGAPCRAVVIRRDPAAAGPAVRSRLHHLDAYARARASEDARGQRSGACAQRAGEGFRHRISRSDAADAGHARPRRHQGVPRRVRRHRHEAALRQRRRGGVSACRARISISARSTTCSRRRSASRG